MFWLAVTSAFDRETTATAVCFVMWAVFLVGAMTVRAIGKGRRIREGIIEKREHPKAKPQARELKYFFSTDGKDYGPHTRDEMRQFLHSNTIDYDTLVIRSDEEQWHVIGHYSEILYPK